MTQAFDSNDVQLTRGDIRQLQHADALAGFLARLQYSIDLRTPIDDYAQIGLSSPDLRHEIRHVELLATDPHDQEIKIYLLEVRSLTAALRNAIARAFRDRPELALFILTKDYETFEFVLLLRELAQTAQRGTAIRQIVRPVPLTIKRTMVSDAELRVLKRFTMSEPDALYQWDKLRSAFVLAEWSEEYFNNRALFSDYYLKQRLTDPKLNSEWANDVLPIGRKINPLLKTARKQLTNQPLASMQKQFYAPILSELGFVTKPCADGPAYRYDLCLLTSSTPVAAFFGYVWNRNLDDHDTQRDSATPAIIPGAEVVSALEAGTVPWVIVSNGKYWRLYSTTASNKATNYYEVDLEEAFFGAQDALDALKYWWLFFRAAAFGGFLDRMLKQSAEYAKGLGERLKDRVFTEIFPQFAQGFIADMRRQGHNTLSESQLNAVFEGTLTFLYRLMFVLYAESLDLLPLNEHNGYREQSLYTIKQELAKAGGTLLDQRQSELQARYTTSSTELYQRILALCAVIDRGSPALNMPTYNGGLFSPSSVSGQFLQTYAVPDRYLALGLDRLARDLDDRSQALVLIDFKSLGVRQLGSIYEGLLEFKLHIASERLAVTKEKGKEVYQPAAKVAKPLAIIEQGMAYLVNDKKERKATGSYYTPDYIVKYIVQQTVGAVLDEKFKALAPRLHEAQKNYRDYAKLVAARAKTSNRPGTADVFWTDPNNTMLQLLDDCLNVRVLDPAMGSGHFLVEVVDFISNRLIHFLNAWSDNPVWAMIDRTRNEIVADMERQGVTIDRERLTRVALLKRAVLKRCIYGVDLNSMAVELAKVSLWLDAFTLGAPLSFLDHHLKHGNSLIGARVEVVREALANQNTLFGQNRFAAIALATESMREISNLSDNTPAQSRSSFDAYQQASAQLAPYKRMLDIYTSRWFNNRYSKATKSRSLPLVKRAKGYGNTFDQTIDLLKHNQFEEWLNDINNYSVFDDEISRVIAESAMIDAKSYSYFHWQLEFPEVYFQPSYPGSKDIDIKIDAGFDAIVSNPPYITQIREDDNVLNYYNESFKSATGKFDLYMIFIERILTYLKKDGIMGSIQPNKFINVNSGKGIRGILILNEFYVKKVIDFGDSPVFEDIITYPSIIIISKEFNSDSDTLYMKVYSDPNNIRLLKHINIRGLGDKPWILDDSVNSLVKNKHTSTLKELGFKFYTGVQTGSDSLLVMDIEKAKYLGIYPQFCLPYARGRNIKRYRIEEISSYVFWPYNENGKILKITQLPIKMQEYLEEHKVTLSNRQWFGKDATELSGAWYGLMYLSDEDTRTGSRLLTPALSDYSNFTYTTDEFAIPTGTAGGYGLRFPMNFELLPYYILALLNSNLLFSLVKTSSPDFANQYMKFSGPYLADLPIRRIEFTTEAAERERLSNVAIEHYHARAYEQVLTQVQQVLAAEQSDVVHDLLAYLAQQMIDLNKAKQHESKRFLGWLESQLRIQPKKDETGIESLSGKTIIQGYLGDYQKGQREVSWGDFWYRLYQNRNRFAANLSDLEASINQAYRQSLAILLPIKHDLARTDALIDKIVYRLYGLSAAEIELIERPQYEQALSEAKANVLKEAGAATSDEQADAIIDKIAEEILPAAERFFERVEPISIEATLDAALPNWRTLPPEIPTFLRTGEYSLLMEDETMDFSVSVIPFTKAVETLLYETIFKPFRDESGFGAADCKNKFLAEFMERKRHLTLGNFPIMLNSKSEQALRGFVSQRFSERNMFGPGGLAETLNNDSMRQLRNKAAHDEVIPRSEAEQLRAWALQVLRI
ncbi:Eco57I restriction-modification methylase domain-containing protein [Herpetosiphon llansteffanensis]